MAHYTDRKVIAEQRHERGLADIDVWNLYSYLEKLSQEIVDRISEGTIKCDADPYFINAYKDICAHEKRFDELQDFADESYSESMTDLFVNMEALGYHMSVAYMNIFHRAILPKLTFDENWVIPQADRNDSLMNPVDYSYAGSFYVKNAIAGIEQIRDRGMSLMGVSFSEEESDSLRNKIIAELKKFEKSPQDSFLNRFCYHFKELWD